MERSLFRPAFAAILLALAGCTTPVVRVIHAPFHPSNTDRVTFTAVATSGRGITEITIVQRVFGQNGFCAAWVAGECVPLATFANRTIKTCTFDGARESERCEGIADAFADGSFVTYGATAKNSLGETGEDKWIGFAAGRQADPLEPIAVYTRGGSAGRIDIVLIPVGFNGVPGATTRDFENAARDLVVNGYLSHAQVTDRRDEWNFYVNPVTGGLSQVVSGATIINRSMTQPANWGRVSAIADAVAYTHTNPPAVWRDFANFGAGGVGAFTINSGAPGTIVHETGHALFGLSDEYCCDGGIIPTSWPHPNLFTTQASCQSSATAHGVPTPSCVQITATNGFCGGGTAANPVLGATNNAWRQDIAGDLMGCGANNFTPGGLLDEARILWYYDTY